MNERKTKNMMIIIVIVMTIFSVGLQLIQFTAGGIQQLTKVKNVYEIKEGYVYFGRPTCPSCKLFEPIVKLISHERRITIYYFNSDYFRKETITTDEELMEVFEKYDVSRIPLLAYIKNGKLNEAFGSELSGNKDQSMVYKEINDMISKVETDIPIRFEWISCIFLCIGTVLYQLLGKRYYKITLKLNKVLFLPFMVNLGLMILWYAQIRQSGLNMVKDECVLAVISIVTTILIAGCYLRNKKIIIKENNHEKD